MRRPATSPCPVTRSSVARSDSYTPRLVGPAGSPEPPTASGSPTTCSVRSLTTSMSSVVEPTSSAVRYRPCSDSTASPRSRKASRRRSASSVSPGARRITDLPPPASRPAAAFFRVIAADSRSASPSASLQCGYVHRRAPPSADPSTDECSATVMNRPLRRPVITSTRSWVKSGRGRVCVIACSFWLALWALLRGCRRFATSTAHCTTS